VDELHIEGVPQDEGDTVVLAQVGQPVPGEHALTADDQALAVGPDGVEEVGGTGGQVLLEDGASLVIKDVGEQGPGMQIDAGVESVRLVVEAHIRVLCGDGPS
jgi:hypothetical protein